MAENIIKIRALTETDFNKTLVWNNQDDIKYFYSDHPFPVNQEMEKKWFEKIIYSNLPLTVFGIELIKENKLIGLSFLKNINLIHRKAEFAIYIGDENERGKGYSKEATIKTIDFGFNSLGLNRIFLFVQNNNKVAIDLYKSLGFKIEGEMRNSLFKKGKFINEYIMSLLKNDHSKNEIHNTDYKRG